MDAYDQAREATGAASLAAHEAWIAYCASPTTAHRQAWRRAEATLKQERAAYGAEEMASGRVPGVPVGTVIGAAP